tara:strand:+ start:135 stop:407 length:273 start_codon:yes stop_codon:yes gene_type:complete
MFQASQCRRNRNSCRNVGLVPIGFMVEVACRAQNEVNHWSQSGGSQKTIVWMMINNDQKILWGRLANHATQYAFWIPGEVQIVQNQNRAF